MTSTSPEGVASPRQGESYCDDPAFPCPKCNPEAAAKLRGASPTEERCRALAQGTPGGNAPADCGFPHCGCFAMADKVVEALIEEGWNPEAGWTPPRPTEERRVLRRGYVIENAKGEAFCIDRFYTLDQARRMALEFDADETADVCPHRPLYVELVVAVPPGEE